jgi:chromosome segregation protein
MHLKRLELFGFKSFADRTVLDFQHGLTGIVGPNGCGKSNVVDAVRWVLGEQRPTSMRGAEMIDVIFKGSAVRAALSVAEVVLVLDNSDGVLDGRGPEVSIMRRVFRGGEGEYLIDGERVRLKDVRAMLYNTGLGSRGYSVLEQGKIDAVLSADPLERRGIFEEAAGVSRYRAQRKEIAARLQRVEQDMVRLEDVIGELESRVRSLKIQAGKAERWSEARTAWRDSAESLARHQIWLGNRELSRLSQELTERSASERELRMLRETAEQDHAARDREAETLGGEIERTAAEAAELAAELRALDERRANLSNRAAAAQAAAEQELQRATALADKLAERERECAAARSEHGGLETRSAAALAEAARFSDALRELIRRARLARDASQAASERVLACMRERTAAQNGLEHLSASLAPLDERSREAERREREARELIGAAQGDRAGAGRSEQEAAFRLERAERARAEFEAHAAQLAQRRARLVHEKQEQELERARARSRIEALLDWNRERESLSTGAQALLGGECAAEVGGLLADRLHTATRHARALDAVLGERAQALVLRDPQQAQKLVDWLRSGKSGQARLVAPGGFGDSVASEAAAALAAGEPPSSAELAAAGRVSAGLVNAGRVVRDERARWLAAQDPDVLLGSLRDFVQVDVGFEKLADALLRDVWLVRDLATALRLVAQCPGLRCATPEGDLVEESGVLGGFREVAQGAFGRRASAAELEQTVAELGARLERCDAEIAELAAEQEQSAARAKDNARDLEHARALLAEARAAGQSAEARCSELVRIAEQYAHEAGQLVAERERALRGIEEARQRLERAQSDFELHNDAHGKAERERLELDSERERCSRSEAEARVLSTRLSEQYAGVQRRVADLERGLAESRLELERSRRIEAEQRAQSAADLAEHELQGARRGELLEGRGGLEVRLSELRLLERAARVGLESLRERAERLTRELEQTVAASSELRLGEQKYELERSEVLRRAADELQLGEGELLGSFEPDPALLDAAGLASLVERTAECKRALDKIGPVNTEAVAELSEVSGRLDFLVAQRSDVQGGRKSLEETLATINAESEKLFLQTFNDIRTNFQSLFRRLFGGGKADITLEENVSVLEAGIEISARPPGREMLPIGLLSGGQRTMTALALLFAVFQARPSPFCLLDEVDAALDDLNIQRFLDMLEVFREKTQFVVVTHNKGTMAACEGLYGVTMEVRGVSRKVSVELADVEKIVPGATGSAIERPRARVLQVASADAVEAEAAAESEPVLVIEPAQVADAPADANAFGATLALSASDGPESSG